MKQLTQNLLSGKVILREIPAPLIRKGCILIRTRKTLISTGTEKMLSDFGNSFLLTKAAQHPERVRQVIDKIKSDGVRPAFRAVSGKLANDIPLGYCNAGIVVAVGEGVTCFRAGDRVVSNGPHAELVCVPENLAAPIPDNVPDDEAAFAIMGSVALQSIRLLDPKLGETVVVTGLGLLGLLTAQLLLLNGCTVIGIELQEHKLEIAGKMGVTGINPDQVNVNDALNAITGHAGADGVIIATASASREILSQAARMTRKKGKIILSGTADLHIDRADFYEKELTFQVSCSYGPGRYDKDYEEKGRDYPFPYVRWTLNRNLRAFLALQSSGKLDVKPLISRTAPLKQYEDAYANLPGSIGTILDFPPNIEENRLAYCGYSSFSPKACITGIIGSGNYVRTTLLPALKNVNIKYIAGKTGISAAQLARKHGIAFCTTDYKEIITDPEVDLVMIATRHHLHAPMTADALKNGKHVFVEKPLAISWDELNLVEETWRSVAGTGIYLHVGFNRRFSVYAEKMKKLLDGYCTNLIITVNAGFVPPGSWVHDPESGGGRLVGEACHFIDLAVFLTGSPVTAVCMNAGGSDFSASGDNGGILLRHRNGSATTINYFSNGHRSYPKERIEAHSLGRTLVLDNFQCLKGYGFKGFDKMVTAQDKGHRKQFAEVVKMIRMGSEPLIPLSEILNVARATLCIPESGRKNSWIKV